MLGIGLLIWKNNIKLTSSDYEKRRGTVNKQWWQAGQAP